MKLKDYLRFIKTERFEEDGVVIFESYCPEKGCHFMGDGTVHHGDEDTAKNVSANKILGHARNDHKFDFED